MAKKYRSGFTLIELLTVIAIIALLAAIIFPVFAQVRNQARKTECITNLHRLSVALKQYKLDEGKYPSSLAPLVLLYNSQPLPLNDPLTQGQLYPELIKAYQEFHCPLSPELNLSDAIPANPMNPFVPMLLAPQGDPFVKAYASQFPDGLPRYYAYDSYDGETIMVGGTPVYDLHYSRWRQLTLNPGGEDPRQLKFRNPPDNTVVTWCSYHRAYTTDAQGNQVVAPGSMDLVLFLDGHVEPRDSKQVIDSQGWMLGPKP